MAVRRSFAAEDKNLTGSTIVTSRNKFYSDIDLSIAPKPSGDVYKKVDAEAVKQSIKTIIQTNHGERPFNPLFGANIRGRLFELNHPDAADEIERDIILAIENYEPRAKVVNIDVNNQIDHNDLRVTIKFKIVSTEEIVVLNTTLTRVK